MTSPTPRPRIPPPRAFLGGAALALAVLWGLAALAGFGTGRLQDAVGLQMLVLLIGAPAIYLVGLPLAVGCEALLARLLPASSPAVRLAAYTLLGFLGGLGVSRVFWGEADELFVLVGVITALAGAWLGHAAWACPARRARQIALAVPLAAAAFLALGLWLVGW